jgi:antibiotic biosynthesis monooxygenase (ABM) superfamily enzyme
MEDEHDPSLDDQSRPDEQDLKRAEDLYAFVNEDTSETFNAWERSFIRSVWLNRSFGWSEKQCHVFDRLVTRLDIL